LTKDEKSNFLNPSTRMTNGECFKPTIKKATPTWMCVNSNNGHEEIVTDFEKKFSFHNIRYCIQLEVSFLLNIQLMLFVAFFPPSFGPCFDYKMFLESLNDRWERSWAEKPDVNGKCIRMSIPQRIEINLLEKWSHLRNWV